MSLDKLLMRGLINTDKNGEVGRRHRTQPNFVQANLSMSTYVTISTISFSMESNGLHIMHKLICITTLISYHQTNFLPTQAFNICFTCSRTQISSQLGWPPLDLQILLNKAFCNCNFRHQKRKPGGGYHIQDIGPI